MSGEGVESSTQRIWETMRPLLTHLEEGAGQDFHQLFVVILRMIDNYPPILVSGPSPSLFDQCSGSVIYFYGSGSFHQQANKVKNNLYFYLLGYLVVDLRWSRWVLSGDVVGQCCLRSYLSSV
jgi:hypothetical protein